MKSRFYDIVLLFERNIKINRCVMEDGYCGRNGTQECAVHKIYLKIQDEFERELKSHTIESIMIDQKKENSILDFANIDSNNKI